MYKSNKKLQKKKKLRRTTAYYSWRVETYPTEYFQNQSEAPKTNDKVLTLNGGKLS